MSAKPYTAQATALDLLTRPCPTCKGTGINPQMPLYVCPKCKGETRLPR